MKVEKTVKKKRILNKIESDLIYQYKREIDWNVN